MNGVFATIRSGSCAELPTPGVATLTYRTPGTTSSVSRTVEVSMVKLTNAVDRRTPSSSTWLPDVKPVPVTVIVVVGDPNCSESGETAVRTGVGIAGGPVPASHPSAAAASMT